jgi:RNA polymerase sigma-70 factor (ECF subfamily)
MTTAAGTTAAATTDRAAQPGPSGPRRRIGPDASSDRAGDEPGTITNETAAAERLDGPLADADVRRAVEAVLAGDGDAFRVLVERESGSVIRTCHRVLGDLHEAEDAAQESFVIAYRSLAGWRGDGSFGAWLGRIAVRTAVRRAKARRPVSRIDPTDPDLGLGSAAGNGVDPAVVALRAEHADDLRRAVNRLDEPYRETVMLRFYGQLSLAEIATEMDHPIGTVKTHLFRGLARLRASMATEGAPR